MQVTNRDEDQVDTGIQKKKKKRFNVGIEPRAINKKYTQHTAKLRVNMNYIEID